MNSQLRSQLVFDGFVCLFEDFDFLSNRTFLNLPTSIIVNVKSDKDFRGVRSLRGKNIAEVQFGFFRHLPVSILVTSSRLTEQISFNDIRKTISQGVDHAVNQLEADSSTLFDWRTRCCREYEKLIFRRLCKNCKKNLRDVHFSIFPADVLLFGQFLVDYLRVSFEEMNYELFISIHQYGQTMSFELACDEFENLNYARINELVVHVARDYWLTGKLLLWNRETVREQLGGGPITDFFCYFTGKHGNFVFSLPQSDDGIQHIKFYSDMFKQVHRGRRSPFRKASVLSVLLGNSEEDLNVIEDNVNAVAECRDLVKRRRYNCARVEAHISLNNDERRSMSSLLADCKLIFEREFGQVARALKVFPFSEMINQIANTLTPALRTLKDIVIKERKFRSKSPGHCAKIETLHQAMACEMVISYFVYGKLDYWKGNGPRFNREMRNILKLNGSSFRFSETFQGLRFTSGISVNSGELRYTGKLLVTNFVTVGITDEENQVRLSNCLEILEGDENSFDRLKQVYEAIAEILWEEILVHAEKTKYNRPYRNVSEGFICKLIERYHRHDPSDYIGTKLFVKWLFRNANLEQLVVRRVLEAVRYFGRRIDLLKKELEVRIENEIYKTGKALLYPADGSAGLDIGHTKVVLPSTGAGDQTFSTTSQEVKVRIASQYRQCCRSISGYFLPIPDILMFLQAAENHSGIPEVVGNILRSMEALSTKLMYVERNGPIINDATTTASGIQEADSPEVISLASDSA